MQYIDVGGGLGIDFDGTKTSSNTSTNYIPQGALLLQQPAISLGTRCSRQPAVLAAQQKRADRELQLINEILLKQGTSQLGPAQQQHPLNPLAVELSKQSLPTLQGELARKALWRQWQQRS